MSNFDYDKIKDLDVAGQHSGQSAGVAPADDRQRDPGNERDDLEHHIVGAAASE